MTTAKASIAAGPCHGRPCARVRPGARPPPSSAARHCGRFPGRAGSTPRSPRFAGRARGSQRPHRSSASRPSATCCSTFPIATATAARCGTLAELRTGEQATVEVEVRTVRVRPTSRRRLRIVEAGVADRSGPATAVWFNQAWLADRLRPGTRLLLSGKLERGRFRVAEHEFVSAESGLHTTGMVPVHPAAEGLSPKRIREWVWQATDLAGEVLEPLPAELRPAAGCPDRPMRSWRPTSPTAARTRNALASGSRSRNCSCTRSRSRPAARHASPAGPGSRSGAR